MTLKPTARPDYFSYGLGEGLYNPWRLTAEEQLCHKLMTIPTMRTARLNLTQTFE
jgi:hypothetical protein